MVDKEVLIKFVKIQEKAIFHFVSSQFRFHDRSVVAGTLTVGRCFSQGQPVRGTEIGCLWTLS